MDEKIVVYGAPWCPDCKRTKRFLGEQRISFEWIDIDEDPEQGELVARLNEGKRIIPTVVFPDGSFLAEPTNAELADKLGLRVRASRRYFDIVIVGGGPAGLTSAIYAAREGIDALVIEASALGGQAGVTQRIDNYPGFPEGIEGAELAGRIIAQAHRYGVEMLSGVAVGSIRRLPDCLEITTGTGDTYLARTVIVATGSSYRRLGVPGEEDLIGAGIHFCATCDGPFYRGAEELMVIGGGNSGLEEGLFLAEFAERIRILEFAPELAASALLQEKVRSHPKFEIHTGVQITSFDKRDARLAAVRATELATGEELVFHPEAAFVFIGLDPNTDFLEGSIDLDPGRFIATGPTLQTSIPGVFAAGDVRRGSTKQLASAVGEGVTALLMVRQYLQQLEEVPARGVG
ncbi:MAG: FAD-dependent oxidoreductase [Actinomycetota bacterium]